MKVSWWQYWRRFPTTALALELFFMACSTISRDWYSTGVWGWCAGMTVVSCALDYHPAMGQGK